MSIYKIDIKEESTNVHYDNTSNKYTFDFKKCTCSDLNIKYIKLEENDIFIYDKNHVQHYKGHLNFLESVLDLQHKIHQLHHYHLGQLNILPIY